MMCCAMCENLQDLWSMGERNIQRFIEVSNGLTLAAIDLRLRRHGHAHQPVRMYIRREHQKKKNAK